MVGVKFKGKTEQKVISAKFAMLTKGKHESISKQKDCNSMNSRRSSGRTVKAKCKIDFIYENNKKGDDG